MNKKLATMLLVALCPTLLNAKEVSGYVTGGLSSVAVEGASLFTAGDTLELDAGIGFALTAGLQFENGVGIRGSYLKASHDDGVYCSGGCSSLGSDTDTSETRVGLMFSPEIKETVGFEVEVGLETLKLDNSALGFSDKLDGPFLRGALLVKAGPTTKIDIGLGYFTLESDASLDFDGAEFKLGVQTDLNGLLLGAKLRGVHLENDDFGITTEVDYGEFGLTIGAAF